MKKNGKARRTTGTDFRSPIADVRASIVFVRPIRDARGVLVSELFEDEASWKLTAQRINVQLGPTPSPLLVGVKQPIPQQLAHIVPVYEVTQLVGEHAVVFLVAAESAVLRMPCGVVTERNIADGTEQQRIMPYREIVARQRAQSETPS